MKSLIVNGILGMIFGWLLSRAGVAEFAHVTGMFALQDFHLIGVLGVAVPIAGLGIFLLKGKKSLAGFKFNPVKKPAHPGNFPGGLLFGAGWALTGACPGTSFVQLGTGHWGALFTILGIGAGVSLYRMVHKRYFHWQMDSCG